MKQFVLILSFVVGIAALTFAQQPPARLLRVSPHASVSQTIGISEVTISYHRPGVKGRTIWGDVVPFGQIWRSGANNATTFKFSDDVEINGTTLKAGSYSFFTIPQKDAWTVIFNSKADQWGAYYYDSTANVLSFSVTPEQATHEEWLSYSFSDLGMSSAKVSLRWEKTSVSFVISTNTMENISKTENDYASLAAQQAALLARYSFDNKTDYERGMKAIDRAIMLKPTYGNLSLKAQMLGQQEKYSEAVKTAEAAIAEGKKSGSNTGALEKMTEEWKQKIDPKKGKKK